MSERLSPLENDPRVQDPRRDLYRSLTPREIELVLSGQYNELLLEQAREGQEFLAAQILRDVHLYSTPEGRNAIHVTVPDISEGQFLPQDNHRAEWEQWHEPDHPVAQANELAAVDLLRVQQNRRPGEAIQFQQSHRLDGVRLSLGIAYEYLDIDNNDPSKERRKLVIRVNNNYGKNIFAGWGNPMSQMVGPTAPMHPIRVIRQSVDEIIPVVIDKETQEPKALYPENFFDHSRPGDWQDYKKKALIVTGEQPEAPRIEHAFAAPVELVKPSDGTGLDLVMEYQYRGRQHQKSYVLRNVNAMLTRQGALEIEAILRIPKPDRLHDPEFGSDIVIADEERIAEWWYKVRNGLAQRDFVPDAVIDGSTGLPTVSPDIAMRYQKDFKASPPLAVIFNELYWMKETGQ